MSKPLVLFTAPVGTRSGYGAHSRDIARSLIAMDKFDIKIFPVRWGSTPQNALNEKDPNDIEIIKRLLVNPNMERQPDVHIHCVVPNEFVRLKEEIQLFIEIQRVSKISTVKPDSTHQTTHFELLENIFQKMNE